MTKQEVQKIARLARLALTNQEIEKYANQLSQVLEYVNQLNEINTKDIETSSQITGLTNVFREDKVEKCQHTEALLEQAPEVEGGGVKVKSVF